MKPRIGLLTLALILAGSAQAADPPKKRLSDYEEGKKIYRRSCWQCHGQDAAGEGPAAAALPDGVPTLRGGIVTRERRDEFIRSILNGKGLMPAFSAEIERQDAKRVLIYLEKYDQRDGREPEAEEDEDDDNEGSELTEEEGNAPAEEEGNEPEAPSPNEAEAP